MTIQGNRFRLYVLIILLGASIASAQVLRQRLQTLPTSIGDNHYCTQASSESWVTIGIREHIGYEHLRRANPNGFGPGRHILIPGRRLPAGLVKDGVVLNLPELMLYYWKDGKVTARYPVAAGMASPRWHTPTGRFQAINRIRNPAWHRPARAGGGVVVTGPANPLGDRWIGLSRRGYGIHGTNDPTSIGRFVSHGCIRLFPAHIHDLFDRAWVGMPIVTTYETVMVGHADGIVYLAIFPDAYSRGMNTLTRVRSRLRNFGVVEAVTDQELSIWLQRADGVARPILGSTMTVTRHGDIVATQIGPTIRQGIAYLPAEDMAQIVGATFQWDSARRTVTLERGERTLSFTMREGEGFMALNTPFIPARATVVRLGGDVAVHDHMLEFRL